ncbi:MAG: hypothetical protein B6244_07550 [Candidatus Cloacimonetes bacterium 4572_55]|nr:MAG: hypothetical protein B6244_07550 [Candidatus Cloacimonetes bacterium 4572_55]
MKKRPKFDTKKKSPTYYRGFFFVTEFDPIRRLHRLSQIKIVNRLTKWGSRKYRDAISAFDNFLSISAKSTLTFFD